MSFEHWNFSEENLWKYVSWKRKCLFSKDYAPSEGCRCRLEKFIKTIHRERLSIRYPMHIIHGCSYRTRVLHNTESFLQIHVHRFQCVSFFVSVFFRFCDLLRCLCAPAFLLFFISRFHGVVVVEKISGGDRPTAGWWLPILFFTSTHAAEIRTFPIREEHRNVGCRIRFDDARPFLYRIKEQQGIARSTRNG